MWRTPCGDRSLSGAEAAPVREAIGCLVDSIYEESSDFGLQFETGVELFDQLPWTQRLALLGRITTALLVPNSETPEQSAVHDAVVGAIFEAIKCMIDMECDFREDTEWRQMVLDACDKCIPKESADPDLLPSSPHDEQRDAWSFAVELLADRVLPDRDYQFSGSFLDAAPDKARHVRQFLGIADPYFSEAAADIREDAAPSLIRSIRQLIDPES